MPQWLAEELDEDCKNLKTISMQKKKGGKKIRKKKWTHRQAVADKLLTCNKLQSPAKGDDMMNACVKIGSMKEALAIGTFAPDNDVCYSKDNHEPKIFVSDQNEVHGVRISTRLSATCAEFIPSKKVESGNILQPTKKEVSEHLYFKFVEEKTLETSIMNTNTQNTEQIQVAPKYSSIQIGRTLLQNKLGEEIKEKKESHSLKFFKNEEVVRDSSRTYGWDCVKDSESLFLLNGLLVPTNEERQEAACKLRNYQSAKISEIIERRLQEKLKIQSDFACSNFSLQEGIKSRMTQHAVWTYPKPTSTLFNSLPPPPGLSFPSKELDDDSTHGSDDFLVGHELILSNMLDDEDSSGSNEADFLEVQNQQTAPFDTASSRVYMGPWLKPLQPSEGSRREPNSLGLLEYESDLWNQDNGTTSTVTTTWGSSESSLSCHSINNTRNGL